MLLIRQIDIHEDLYVSFSLCDDVVTHESSLSNESFLKIRHFVFQ